MKNLIRLLEREIELVGRYERAQHIFIRNSRASSILKRIEIDHREAVNILSRQLVRQNSPLDQPYRLPDELDELREEEDSMIKSYLQALETIAPEVQTLVKSSLLPKVRSHLFALEKIEREDELTGAPSSSRDARKPERRAVQVAE